MKNDPPWIVRVRVRLWVCVWRLRSGKLARQRASKAARRRLATSVAGHCVRLLRVGGPTGHERAKWRQKWHKEATIPTSGAWLCWLGLSCARWLACRSLGATSVPHRLAGSV